MIRNLIGQQLGNYRLEQLLGSGGFASVYLGQHVQIATQQAAIKILHLTEVNTQIFQQEAVTIASLKHPHIVRLFDYVIQQGMPLLVMDYAPNGSLRTRHATGEKVSLAIVIQYVTQIADALQYAHDKHIIHRDIKPDNVLIGSHGELLLSDFGIAVISKTGRTTLQSPYGTAGTPYYMSPEMFSGKPEKASDQYALGVMVYQWLSGTLPFSEGNFIQLGYQHAHNPVPPLRDRATFISVEVEAVVMRALAKEPHQRFATVLAFATALEQASLTKPLAVVPPQPNTAPSQPKSPAPIVLAPSVIPAPAQPEIDTPLSWTIRPPMPSSVPEHKVKFRESQIIRGYHRNNLPIYALLLPSKLREVIFARSLIHPSMLTDYPIQVGRPKFWQPHTAKRTKAILYAIASVLRSAGLGALIGGIVFSAIGAWGGIGPLAVSALIGAAVGEAVGIASEKAAGSGSGAAIGGIAGLLIAIAIGAAIGSVPGLILFTEIVAGLLIGLILGAAIGAAIGAHRSIIS